MERNWRKDPCVVLYKYVRYVSGGRFIRMLFSLWYTISWKNISLSLSLSLCVWAPVLLSIPRRVCRARVSRSNRGEKLHRRITGGKTLGVATVSEPDKNISFNAWKRGRHHHVGNFAFSIRFDSIRGNEISNRRIVRMSNFENVNFRKIFRGSLSNF